MPDAGGNIKGIALGGNAGDVLERIQRRERMYSFDDQENWPDHLNHLRDDAVYMTCDTCGRHAWNPDVRIGTSCGMPQPTGGPCEGHFIESERIT